MEKNLDPPKEQECQLAGHDWKKVTYELAGLEFYRCRVCGQCEEELEEVGS